MLNLAMSALRTGLKPAVGACVHADEVCVLTSWYWAAEMGKDLLEFKAARDIFDRADAALGFSLTSIMFNATESERLRLTENAQPAILTHSIAVLEVLKQELAWDACHFKFAFGHSLGEFSAACATGVMTFERAVQLVVSLFLSSPLPQSVFG